MARPVHANAEATRGRILAAASRLFAERDHGGASFRDIAAAAEVSIGTVHHYFGGKDALHRACIDAMYDDLSSLQETLWPALQETSAQETVQVAVHASFAFARSHRQSLVLLMREVVRRGELDEDRRAVQHRPFLERASALLTARTGTPPDRCRLALQSTIHLVVRYALSSNRDLLMFAGLSEEGDDAALAEAIARIEAQLVRFVTAELNIVETPNG
jgi:AcrR family transcriptional regulator